LYKATCRSRVSRCPRPKYQAPLWSIGEEVSATLAFGLHDVLIDINPCSENIMPLGSKKTALSTCQLFAGSISDHSGKHLSPCEMAKVPRSTKGRIIRYFSYERNTGKVQGCPWRKSSENKEIIALMIFERSISCLRRRHISIVLLNNGPGSVAGMAY
jgi:hypothetical protein